MKLHINKEWELDLLPEHRTQFALKGKRKHIVKVNIPILTYPNQNISIEIPHGSRDHIVPDTIRITFNLDIESMDKACNINNVANNVSRALVKKSC